MTRTKMRLRKRPLNILPLHPTRGQAWNGSRFPRECPEGLDRDSGVLHIHSSLPRKKNGIHWVLSTRTFSISTTKEESFFKIYLQGIFRQWGRRWKNAMTKWFAYLMTFLLFLMILVLTARNLDYSKMGSYNKYFFYYKQFKLGGEPRCNRFPT